MREIRFESLYIATTQSNRNIRILLPNDYETSHQKYPVLYMHDGQNLFEDETSYAGTSWNISQTLDALIKDHQINDIIVVGVDHSHLRFSEYSPWECDHKIALSNQEICGGLGDLYAKFIVEDLKPWIDSNYRTLKDYAHTMIAGSSMGAYISSYIAVKYTHTFKHVGIFSLASWFNEEDFLTFMKTSHIDQEQQFFISIGRNETSNDALPDFNDIYLSNSRNLYNLLKDKNVKNILYIETDDTHHESAWQKMFVDFIKFTNKSP